MALDRNSSISDTIIIKVWRLRSSMKLWDITNHHHNQTGGNYEACRWDGIRCDNETYQVSEALFSRI
jgi:hypothetical protein